MCGIVGIIGLGSKQQIDVATDRIAHRGPDGRATWTSSDDLVSLGHRRLSIIDTSTSANQPMISRDGRFCIVYNGEIYNYRQLRTQLDGTLRTSSDTEVLLELVAKFGFEQTLEKLNGMFVFAVYDMQQRKLHLARDRMGEKPLYYGRVGSLFAFGSELKSLRAIAGFDSEVDNDVLATYLRYSCVPAPLCIYKGLYKLDAAHALTVAIDSAVDAPQNIQPYLSHCYWDLLEKAQNGNSNLLSGDEVEVIAILQSQISNSVRSRMVADVPLGAFLSGGYDSSLVVSMMQQSSATPVKTFSIGFEDEGYNEAKHASAVAKHIGTDHTELYINSQDALDLVPKLPEIYCEPFADSSQIPTLLVSQLARKHVTVALSGDGGDELFGGYNRHYSADRVWKKFSRIPRPLRALFSKLAVMMSPSQWDWFFSKIIRSSMRLAGEKVHKLAEASNSTTPIDLYRRLVSSIQSPASMLIHGSETKDKMNELAQRCSSLSYPNMMMAVDAYTYLPNDILTKVDRASMAVSLEARVPLIDHELVELAWRIPQTMKIRNGEGKWILKQIVHRCVPESLMRRPKMGFAIPIGSWLHNELRDWMMDLISPEKLRYFDPKAIQSLVARHRSGAA